MVEPRLPAVLLPAGQAAQLPTAPGTAENVPAAHCWHARDPPEPTAKKPALHAHVPAPALLVLLPGQLMHASACGALNELAGHCWHTDPLGL